MKPARHIVIGSTPWAGDPGTWDGYRFGSETCPDQVPSTSRLLSLVHGLSPQKRVLVTPLLGPGEVDGALRTAAKALDAGWGEVVVNDWGLLSELSRRGAGGLAAGRLLMRFRRGPGAADPWDGLDEEARRYFAWGPLFDGRFLRHLQGMGVVRVEADLPRHWMPVPAADGMAVSLHARTRFISLAASCPWLFDPTTGNWRRPHRCARPCKSRGDIVLHASSLRSPLRLRGRAIIEVMEDTWIEPELPVWVDRLIFEKPPSSGTVPA